MRYEVSNQQQIKVRGGNSPQFPMQYNLSSTSLHSSNSSSDSLSYQPSMVTGSNSKSAKKHRMIEMKMLTSLRNLLMVLALSIHSIFEGMTIGLEDTESGVWKLFLAISIHAIAIVFCIGTEMIAMDTTIYKIVMYMVVLSMITPIGVFIGILECEIQANKEPFLETKNFHFKFYIHVCHVSNYIY